MNTLDDEMCDTCKHRMDEHDDSDGCSECHAVKDECIAWIKFRDDYEDRGR